MLKFWLIVNLPVVVFLSFLSCISSFCKQRLFPPMAHPFFHFLDSVVFLFQSDCRLSSPLYLLGVRPLIFFFFCGLASITNSRYHLFCCVSRNTLIGIIHAFVVVSCEITFLCLVFWLLSYLFVCLNSQAGDLYDDTCSLISTLRSNTANYSTLSFILACVLHHYLGFAPPHNPHTP